MPREEHSKRGGRGSIPRSRKVSQRIYRPSALRKGNWRVRVKRWGKSPPRRQRCRRHEKPRPVQGKIGGWAARPIAAGMPHPRGLARGTQGQDPQGLLREMTDAPPKLAQAITGGKHNPAYSPGAKTSPPKKSPHTPTPPRPAPPSRSFSEGWPNPKLQRRQVAAAIAAPMPEPSFASAVVTWPRHWGMSASSVCCMFSA